MTEFEPAPHGDAGTGGGTAGAKMDAAREEAVGLKDAATSAAADVAGTAREEGAKVVREATSQAKDLFHQAQGELRDQAAHQQERVASGLHSLGRELRGMSSSAEEPGMAADLVEKAADRAEAAAAWLDARDPGSLVTEVKEFARRHTGLFLAIAGLAGVAAGRLTRALAAGQEDDGASDGQPGGPGTAAEAPLGAPDPVQSAPMPPAPVPPAPVQTTPLYEERLAASGPAPAGGQPIPPGGVGA